MAPIPIRRLDDLHNRLRDTQAELEQLKELNLALRQTKEKAEKREALAVTGWQLLQSLNSELHKYISLLERENMLLQKIVQKTDI